MSDPVITDSLLETAKTGATGGGVGMVLLALVQRFFKKAEVDDEREAKALESVLAELRLVNSGISEVKAKVDVLSERMSGVLARVDKNELKLEEALERLAKLEGQFSHLSDNLAR